MKYAASLFITLALLIAPAAAAGEKYTCPMHPHYIADEPGTCPICGMDLVPMESGGGEAEDARDENERTAIMIAPEIIQNIGVRTEKAQMARFGTRVRSYGLVTENIRLRQDISTRVDGWIERLDITAVGDEVQEGDLLFALYSPQLVSAQQDYLAALATGASNRVRAAAARLKSLGVQDKVLATLKATRKKLEHIPTYAETDGVVSQLSVKHGTYVTSGMRIAEIQDYSIVWINVSVAEKDMRFLAKDGVAMVAFPNLGGAERNARIDYIYPTIDPASRTGQIRLVMDNVDGALKPGAYADVEFETRIENRLSIPAEAILKSSEGDFVVIAEEGGRFRPRMVKTGITSRGRTEIQSGVEEGDDVVVSSQFMIDSESALREAFRKLQKSQTPLSLLEVDENQLAMINHLVDAALYIQETLAVGEEFDAKLLMPALGLNDHLMPRFRGTRLQFVLEAAESAIMQSRDSLTTTELRDSLAALIEGLKPWLFEGRPQYYREKGVKLFMDHGTGRLWLQLDASPANPYGDGHAMPQDWPAAPIADMPSGMSGEAGAPVGGAHANH